MPGPVMRNPAPQWLTDPSVTDSFTTKALRAILTTLGADSPSSQVLGLMSTMVPSAGKTGGLVGKVTEALKGIKAYHGSPHDFDQFSMKKIGTGEGAQAYGHGLYFAENEATAKAYRAGLSGHNILVNGQPIGRVRLTPNQRAALEHLERTGTSPTSPNVFQTLGDAFRSNNGTITKDWRQFTQEWNDLVGQNRIEVGTPRGKTYEVNINADPDTFLDWDKPLSQQSEKVKTALTERGIPTDSPATGATLYEYLSGYGPLERAEAMVRRDVFGRAPSSYASSGGLRQAGIPGIKYLDQGSRSAGEGSRNYVVFDDSIIDILKKYGLLLPAAGAGLAQQQESTR